MKIKEGFESSVTKNKLHFPYRLCLAGGWMDQPWVSEISPGSVVVAQIWPTQNFNDRSGLATSSRKVGIQMWGDRYPAGDPLSNAKALFDAENLPGREYVSGSQDHLGLMLPGVNKLHYDGSYWPEKIDSLTDSDICEWLSNVIHLIPLKPRPDHYNPLKVMNLKKNLIEELGKTGDLCWESIMKKNITGFGKALTNTLLSWKKILPLTVPDWVMNEMETKYFNNYPGATTCGSGGGYVMVASEKEIEGEVKIKIRY